MKTEKTWNLLFCCVACFNWNFLVVCGYQIPFFFLSKTYQANIREKQGRGKYLALHCRMSSKLKISVVEPLEMSKSSIKDRLKCLPETKVLLFWNPEPDVLCITLLALTPTSWAGNQTMNSDLNDLTCHSWSFSDSKIPWILLVNTFL